MHEARQLPGRAAIRMQIRGGADARRKLQPGARLPDRKIITAVRHGRAAVPDCGRQTFPPHRASPRRSPPRPPPLPAALTGARGGAVRAAAPLPHAAAAPTSAAERRRRDRREERRAAPPPARSFARSVPPPARTWVGAGGQLTGCALIGSPAAAAPSARGGTIRGHAHSPRSSPRSPAPRRAGSVRSFRTSLRAPVGSPCTHLAPLRRCNRAARP